MNIPMNSTVTAPITDKDGEETYIIGKLVDINSRFAKIETSDGKTISVGKTKIELVETKAQKDKSTSNGRIASGYNYQKVKAASGRDSLDNGDKIAQMLRGKTLEDVYKIAARFIYGGGELAEIEEGRRAMIARYQHLNPGQQRMNVGNLMRGHLRREK